MKKATLFFFWLCMGSAGFTQQRTVAGIISTESGKPISGATISVKEYNEFAVSDTAGIFVLMVPAKAVIVHVTHIGFVAQTFTVGKSQNDIQVYLKQDESVLQNVIVSTGYENIPKERATGSFTSINNALLNRNVSTDVLSHLENVSNGLLFDHRNNGQPVLSIRGQSTILSNAAPLIVVDNFPYEGDINNLNPNDIENVTILKDAAAASIWGSRAGNGVIVITTKKGPRSQPLQLELNSNITIGDKSNLYYNRNFLNSPDFIDVEKMLFNKGYYSWQEGYADQTLSPVVQLLIAKRDGKITPDDAEARINALKQIDVRKDISKYFYQESVNQQYALSLSGGQPKLSYFFSGGFDNNKDNLVRNGLSRVTLHSATTYHPVTPLDINIGITYTNHTQKENNTGAAQINSGGGKGLYPYARIADASGKALPVIRDYSSDYVAAADSNGLMDWNYRPLQDLRNADYTFNTEDTRLNTGITYHFKKWLKLEALYQYEHQILTVNNLQNVEMYYVRNLINQFAWNDGSGVNFAIPKGGILDHAVTSTVSHSGRLQLNIDKSWGSKNEITALAGAEMRQAIVSGLGARLYGYDDDLATAVPVNLKDQLPVNPYGYTQQIPSNALITGLTDRNISYFANASYSYNKKYILTASARKDESNLFGVNANQKGVPLWSAGIAWIASSEKIYPFASWLPYVKVRITNGVNGNVNKSLTAYTTASYSTDYYAGLPQLQILTPPNADLSWEKIHVINLGIDFESNNNVLSGSLEYYHKKGMNLIGNAPLDPTAGFNVAGRTNFTGNNADMKGHGFDVQLALNERFGTIKWTSVFLFNYTTDKITKFDYQSTVYDYLSDYPSPMVGKPRFGIYSFKWAGLDPATGDPQVYIGKSVTKDYATISYEATPADLAYNGPSLPPYFGSWRNTFSISGVSIGCNITYKLGYYFKRSSINYVSLFDHWAGNVDFKNRWQQPGDEKTTQVPSMPASPDNSRDLVYSNSSVLVEKGDHIRLQDINLSYRFNKANNHWLPFNSLSVYGYINNIGILWRANHYNIDPDYIFQPYPPSKTYSIGISIQF
ncbi:MAG: SusC/RagA family TonB-linked outer membrane protein [Ginsengibacter sp.]